MIGGGVAGLSAALRAAELGADVVLVDDGPELGGTALAGDGPDRGRRAGAARSRRRGRGAGAGRSARLLRRDRARLDAEHAAPDPRRAPHRRHRVDRAAADVRGQRPARGDAVLGRAAARLALRGPSGQAGGRRDDGRPGPRVGARAPRRRGRDRRRRRRAPERAEPGSARAARGGADPALRGSAVVRAARARAGDAERSSRSSTGTAARSPTPSATSTAIWSRSPAARCRRPRCCCRPAAKARWDAAAGAYLPDAHAGRDPRRRSGRRPRVAAAGRALGRGRRSRGGALARARRRRPTGHDSRPSGEALAAGAESSDRASSRRPPASRARAQAEVLRLPLRGRDHQGHRLRDRRGLRLARAAEALHDRDHGPVPGPHVPARLDPADRRRHRRRTSPRSG